jgi:predicted transcriptional regulator
MRHYCVIADYDTLRVINDPLRMNLLGGLISRAETGKQIADRLGLSASRIHYHLKELEQYGLIEVQHTEEKNGIMQKFYRAIAYDFLIDEELLPIVHNRGTLFQDSVITQLQMTIARVHQTPASDLPIKDYSADCLPVIFGNY